MNTYVVSETYYFKEIGQKVQAGQTVTLRRGDAERYLRSHPGLLRLAALNTMAEIPAVRGPEAQPSKDAAPAEEVAAELKPATEKSAETPTAEAVEPEAKPKKSREKMISAIL